MIRKYRIITGEVPDMGDPHALRHDSGRQVKIEMDDGLAERLTRQHLDAGVHIVYERILEGG